MLAVRFVLCVSVLFAAGACKKLESGSQLKVNSTDLKAPAVDMNDLSYMFARNKTGQIYPFIPVSRSWSELSSEGKAGLPILTPAVYRDIVAATENPGNFTPKSKSLSYKGIQTPFKATDSDRFRDFVYDRFVVTSFRIDPCAPSLVFDKDRTTYQGPSKYWPGKNGKAFVERTATEINTEIGRLGLGFQLSSCQTQIRLILQQVDESNAVGESTIHMVYTIDGQGSRYQQPSGVMHPDLSQAVLDLKLALQKATKIDTTGLMLQEHPGLRYEAMSNRDATRPGAGAVSVIKFLQKYLSPYQDPQVMAIIRETRGKVAAVDGRTTDGIIDVILGGGTNGGRYQAAPLVNSSPSNGFIMTSSSQRGAWQIAPSPELKKPINIGIFNTPNLRNASHSENEVLSRLMAADNPETTHFFSNDCITCHGTSQLLRDMPNKETAQGNSQRFRVPAGVSGFPIGSYLPGRAEQVGGVMLRNFGYSRNLPVIGLRAVTETAILVDYFNRDLRGVPNPGADCSTPQRGQLEAQLWARTMNIGLKTTFRSAEDYRLDLERLRTNRQAPEDDFFAKCNKRNKVAFGKRGTITGGGKTPSADNDSGRKIIPIRFDRGASTSSTNSRLDVSDGTFAIFNDSPRSGRGHKRFPVKVKRGVLVITFSHNEDKLAQVRSPGRNMALWFGKNSVHQFDLLVNDVGNFQTTTAIYIPKDDEYAFYVDGLGDWTLGYTLPDKNVANQGFKLNGQHNDVRDLYLLTGGATYHLYARHNTLNGVTNASFQVYLRHMKSGQRSILFNRVGSFVDSIDFNVPETASYLMEVVTTGKWTLELTP